MFRHYWVLNVETRGYFFFQMLWPSHKFLTSLAENNQPVLLTESLINRKFEWVTKNCKLLILFASMYNIYRPIIFKSHISIRNCNKHDVNNNQLVLFWSKTFLISSVSQIENFLRSSHLYKTKNNKKKEWLEYSCGAVDSNINTSKTVLPRK